MDPERFKKDRSAPRIPIVDGLREAYETRDEPGGVATSSSSVQIRKRRAEQIAEPTSKRQRECRD